MSQFRIHRLEVVDFKRIEAAVIDAKGHPITLTGDNGQGKTSVLDSIMWALTRKGTDKPIHDGAEQATVALTLHDGEQVAYTIRRREKDGGGHYLDVLDAAGGKVASPQKFLDGLVGNLAFDPEAFARMKAKEQADALRQATGLDTSDLDDEYKEKFAQRTEANRAKEKAEQLYKAAPIASGGQREVTSAKDLIEEQRQLAADLATARQDAKNHAAAQDAIAAATLHVRQLQEQLAAAQKAVTAAEENAAGLKAIAEATAHETEGYPARLAEIDAQLGNIDAANAEAQAHNKALEDREAKREAYADAVKRWTQLDNRLKELVAAREERIAAAKFPVEGLSIEDDTVKVHGIPFADLNTAERIKLSALIAMAQNPTLKVIFIREGALISRQNLAVLEELAEAHGCQIFVEVFSETPREKGFHIVEGSIALQDGQQPAPAQMELI